MDRVGVTANAGDRAAVARLIAALAMEQLPGTGDVLTHVIVLPDPALPGLGASAGVRSGFTFASTMPA